MAKVKIVKNPEICSNSPRIAGTRITVSDVVCWHHDLGWSVEKIQKEYPHLTKQQIDSALEYFKKQMKKK